MFFYIIFSWQYFGMFLLSKKKMSGLQTQWKILKKGAANRQKPKLTKIVRSNLLKCKTFLYAAKEFSFVHQT